MRAPSVMLAFYLSALFGVTFVSDGTLNDADTLVSQARAAWAHTARVYAISAQAAAPEAGSTDIVLRRVALPVNHSGASRMGQIALRQSATQRYDAATGLALYHEVAHQFLLHACPAAHDDRLLHEAFALGVSGELAQWGEGPYMTASQALQTLLASPNLDGPRVRQALARLLEERPLRAVFPEAVSRRLRLCAIGALPREPLHAEELTRQGGGADALVVLSRHSGEILEARGAVHRAMPYGSLLKPFIAAAHGSDSPSMPVHGTDPMWQCGHARGTMTLAQALPASCNGYFLAWSPNAPLGPYTDTLVKLGLGRAPLDAAEAIGLKTALALSPWALAQAYRLLAESSPQTLHILKDTVTTGTLAGARGSEALRGWSVKTGTVRDAASRPLLGWIAAANADLIVVQAVKDRAPRDSVEKLARSITPYAKRRDLRAVDIEAFTTTAARAQSQTCDTGAVVVDAVPTNTAKDHRSSVRALSRELSPLHALKSGEVAVCLGQPWRIDGRVYAGALVADAAGSFTFRTTLGAYTAGVLQAEDAQLRGAAATALARVVAHNATHGRHPGARPCDTTHCQVFRGTAQRVPAVVAALSKNVLPTEAWLHFSRGGIEPWRAHRTASEVREALGHGFKSLTFGPGIVRARADVRARGGVYEDLTTHPCEVLRAALSLPSCPESAAVARGWVEFRGAGAGHGVGLDVEWAKSSGLSDEAILQRAYFNHR